ncbi:MAG: mechanosensitive ion channel domain-containing protein [Bacteroidales bacterium]|jgi:small conductance mechanosensitive channel|nr:mechanosensitive ion channel domain-containing protein [Bacteroidales bacterium]
MENLNTYTDEAMVFITDYGPRVLGALVVLILGLWLISWITKLTKKGFRKGKVDESLIPFLASLVNWTLKALLFISVASMIGIATTSFIAVIGAAGLAIGLALQGTLGNFAGGVIILLFKPYKVGDLIEAQGFLGVVEEIQIFVTKMRSPQNELIIIPNGAISNGSLQNYTETPHRRVDCTIGISYDSDIKKAREVLMGVLTSHPKVLKDPEPVVMVSNLGDSSVDLAVRPHVDPADYWDVYFYIYEEGKIALDKAGITIPFPQRDVHLFQKG